MNAADASDAGSNASEAERFFAAVRHGHDQSVRSLLAASPELLHARDVNSFGGPALNIAIFRQDRKMIETLLELGADPNTESDWWAGPWNAVQSALQSGQDELAESLIQRGGAVGVHEAAGLAKLDQLRALLHDDPSRVDQRGGDGCTPLHFAGSTEVVDLLLEHQADIDARDIDHYSTAAQYLAQRHPAVTRYLFRRGAAADLFAAITADDDLTVGNLIAADPSLLQQRINRETFPPGPDHEVDNILTFTIGHNATPMHAAAVAGRLDMIDRLVDWGVDIDITGGYDDSTALHAAAWNDSLETAKKLVTSGADIDRRSGSIHNNTPAGWAIVAGSADVFEYLIDQGATAHDHFHRDVAAALRGEFLQYKCVPIEQYQRIAAKLA